ncbi:MAG: hypothetical protein K9G67_12825 [Bacteroidales bacterium]|nr:hypothetical protein [Bacteroidales bacterium]MCF8377234.1 hypothetical protein [Bacteroidales bacterium]
MILLHQAFRPGILLLGQAACMQQPEEHSEVGIQAFIEHLFEINFQVGQADDSSRIPQQTDNPPIGHKAIQVGFGIIQVFLQQGMGRHTQSVGLFIHILFMTGDDYREPVHILNRISNMVGFVGKYLGRLFIPKVIAQQP